MGYKGEKVIERIKARKAFYLNVVGYKVLKDVENAVRGTVLSERSGI